MWSIKRDGKFKRFLATLLGFCVVIQMTIGNLAPISAYAQEKEAIIYKDLTISEKELQKALERGRDIEDVELKTPYKGEQEERAKEVLDGILLNSVLVKQVNLKDKCRAVIAVYSSGESEEAPIDQVILVGMNGNANKSCVFTLRITNAEGIVIRTVTLTAYAQGGERASGSDASPSDATPSDADEEATPSEAGDLVASNVVMMGEEDTQAEATPSESGNAEAATSSEAAKEDEAVSDAEYTEEYSYTLGEEEIANMVEYKKERALLGANSPEEEANALSESRKNIPAPMMIVKSGGFGVALLDSADVAAPVDVGIITDFRVTPEDEEVLTGEYSTFNISATYNNVNTNIKAYFTVKFNVDEGFDEDKYLTGPETSENRIVDDSDSEWSNVKEMLKDSDYSEYASSRYQWRRIIQGAASYFYCPEAKLAIIGRMNGDATSGQSIKFQFKNGITPDGVTIEAVPGILNPKQLIDSYLASYDEKEHPAAEKPTEQEVAKALLVGDTVSIVNKAVFKWDPVTKTANRTTLGNIWDGADTNPVTYTITAKPHKENNTTNGIIYTESCTVEDTMSFGGMVIDMTGRPSGTEPLTVSSRAGQCEVNIWSGSTKSYQKLFTVNLKDATASNFTAEVIVDGENPNLVTGVKFAYTNKNNDLEQDLQLNDNDNVTVTVPLIALRNSGVFTVKDAGAFAGDMKAPYIDNTVKLDAYSLFYDGAATALEKEKHHHSSDANVRISAQEKFSITKKAFLDKECTKEAIGVDAAFDANTDVWYQITVKNLGYDNEQFTVKDTLPDGLEPTSVKLIGLKVGDKVETQLPNGVTEGSTVTWNDIHVPTGASTVLTVQAKLKDADAFDPEKTENKPANTRLDNKVELFEGPRADGKAIGSSTATIYAKSGALTEGQLELKKESDMTNPIVDARMTYTITSKLKDSDKGDAVYSQYVTVTDDWPAEQVRFTQIVGLKSGGKVVLKNAANEIIGQYENVTAGNISPWYDAFTTPAGKKLTEADTLQIAHIEITLFLEKGVAVKTKIAGRLRVEGVAVNKVHEDSGSGATAEVTTTAINMTLDKKAYYIGKDSAGNITEKTNMMSGSNIFGIGDVVCYDVTMTNKDLKKAIQAVAEDDLSALLGPAEAPKFAFAKAKLDEADGCVFYKISDQTVWNVLEADPEKADAKIKLDLKDKNISIPKGGSCTLRFYLKVLKPGTSQTETLKYRNTAKAGVYMGDKTLELTPAWVDISVLDKTDQKATIKKEVLAIGGKLDFPDSKPAQVKPVYLENARWFNSALNAGTYKGYESTDDIEVGAGDYVLYKITIGNPGKNSLRVYEIGDQLPKDMELHSFVEINDGNFGKETGAIKAVGNYKLQVGTRWQVVTPDDFKDGDTRWLYLKQSKTAVAGFELNKAVVEKTKNGNERFRARLGTIVNKSLKPEQAPEIPAGQEMSFAVLAKVKTGATVTGTSVLTNTADAVVEDASRVEAVDCDVKKVEWLGETTVGGKTYTDDYYQVITADVSVTGSEYTPGIEKKLTSYYGFGDKWHNYEEEPTGIYPENPMRWTVTLQNGTYGMTTAGAIKSYTIVDVLPEGMTYNMEDPAEITLSDSDEPVKLPTPKMKEIDGSNGTKQTQISWIVEAADDRGFQYKIYGADGEPETSSRNWMIPKGGTLSLQIGTKAKSENGLKYGTYLNRAELIPAETYSFSDVSVGYHDKEKKSVYADATVNIYGAGVTTAWKTLNAKYNDQPQTADGRQNEDNYVMADAGSVVSYSLNVQNQISNGGMTELVLIDRLPSVGDNGLMNNALRQSDFSVAFADNTEVQVVFHEEESGKEIPLNSSEFEVYYAESGKIGLIGSALPSSNWSDNTNWGQKKNKDSDCIKIVVKPDKIKELKLNDIVTVNFKARLPERVDVTKEEMIAWNSFAYSYHTTGNQEITVEPAKVGVQIPTAKLSVSKSVVSDITGDHTREFRFKLMEAEPGKENWKPATAVQYRIKGNSDVSDELKQTQGEGEHAGEFTLTDGQTAIMYVMADKKYKVAELEAEGFYVTVTGPSGTTSQGMFDRSVLPEAVLEAAEVRSESYKWSFTNTKTSLVLPETGGIGTEKFHMTGAAMAFMALLMLLGYYMKESVCKGRIRKRGDRRV